MDITDSYSVEGLYDDLKREIEEEDYTCAAITVSWLQHEFGVRVRIPLEWAALIMLEGYNPADGINWSEVDYE